MGSAGRSKSSRARYAPRLEALESLRLLDAAASHLFPLLADHEPLPVQTPVPLTAASNVVSWPGLTSPSAVAGSAAWDEALSQAVSDCWPRLVDSGALTASAVPLAAVQANQPVDPAAINAGLRQIDRYLGSAWARSGIPTSQQEDCTQAVHTAMLQQLGRPAFDQMLADVGHVGVTQVLNRDSALGPDFFRAVDMVKKRATRERKHSALEDIAEPMAQVRGGDGAETWRGVLNDAINRSLNPREANVIRATLQGFTPAEIAQQWGLAPKTVSNEKTRALAKLREVLVAELND